MEIDYPQKRNIELNRDEIIGKLYNPPLQGRWLLAVDPNTLKAWVIVQLPNGYVPDVEGHEDLFPLLMTLEHEDGFIEGGDWLVAFTPNKKEHDGIYRSYWVKWAKQGKEKTDVISFPRALRVFLCHASEDKSDVCELYNQLQARWIDPWLDEEKILPGQDWRQEITKAIRNTDVVIICLSQRSTKKTGFVQKEISFALDVALEQLEGSIFLIPLRLEKCNVPERLCRWQWVDYFEDIGYNLLLRALKVRTESLGICGAKGQPQNKF